MKSLPATKLTKAAAVSTLLLTACCATVHAQTVLTDFDFNNVSGTVGYQRNSGAPAGYYDGSGGKEAGSLSTATGVSDGEYFTTGAAVGTSGHYYSSTYTSNNPAAVYSGVLGFSNQYVYSTTDGLNQGYLNDSGYGAGYDSATGISFATSGTTAGFGSLLLWGGGSGQVYATLNSTGYQNLTLSFQLAGYVEGNTAVGAPSLSTHPYIALSYATAAGGTYSTPVNYTGLTTGYNTVSVNLPSTLNNLGAISVELNANFNDGGTSTTEYLLSVDNLELTGIAVPEPSTWALMGVSAGLLAWSVRRKVSVTSLIR